MNSLQYAVWFLCLLLLSYDIPEHSFCSRSVIVVSCPCDAYGSLSVMMISSFCLDSLLLAVAPYCCLSPLFMCLPRNECLSFFIHPFISYVSVYTTLYLFPLYLVIILWFRVDKLRSLVPSHLSLTLSIYCLYLSSATLIH